MRVLLDKVLFLAACCLVLAACGKEEPTPEYVSRIGDHYLTREQVAAALESMPAGVDTTEAQRQVVEQWIDQTLLYQEAERRGLRSDPEVQRLLEENERSVIVSALLSHLYDEVPAEPSPSELEAYYERHKEQLRLREPYARVRYLATRNLDSAETARGLIQRLPPSGADSVWVTVINRFAHDPDGSFDLSTSYYPESQVLAPAPAVKTALMRLRNNEVSPIVESDSLYHIVQLVERVPEGSIPPLEWVQDNLMRLIAIQSRKQIYARQVERLRNEALAREDLELAE